MILDIGLVASGVLGGWAALLGAGVAYLNVQKRRTLRVARLATDNFSAALANPYAQYRTSRDGES